MILSGFQLMVKTFASQRPSLNNIWPEVFPANGPQPKSLIEISGAPGTGKRILLYQLMARAALSTFYGGKYSQVIFIDLSHKFDVKHFEENIQYVMSDSTNVSSQTSLTSCLKYCESIVHLPCYSSDQFEFVFEDMEELMWDNRKVSLIAIDGLDTFYWDDCYNQLQRMTTHYKKCIQRLKLLCKEHNICCAYTLDNNCLIRISKASSYFPHSQIDYKLKLTKQQDGTRYLNHTPIEINCNGILDVIATK